MTLVCSCVVVCVLCVLSSLFLFSLFLLSCSVHVNVIASPHTVAKDIDVGVMQLIVECTAVTMENMSRDYHVTYWGCKVFANATNNGKQSNKRHASLYVYTCCHMF